MPAQKPNVIYILTDDHRSELLGFAGHPILKTPNLDRLARQGTRFSNAFCTSPICTPSRTCHYLGQWERRHGINFNSSSTVSPEAWDNSFPMILKKEGYFLGWVGKNHVPVGEGGYRSGYIETTFDYWYGNHNHCGFYVKDGEKFDIYQNAKADTQVEVFEQGFINFLSPHSEFIDNCAHPLPYRPRDQPFCLCITFNLPHANGIGSMELRPTDDELYRTAYRDGMEQIVLPETYVAYDEIKTPRVPKEVYAGDYLPVYDFVREPAALKEALVRTYQTLTGIDRTIGRLLEELDRLDLTNQTIIVFSTDHGIHYGEHGLGGKCFLYEEDLRIPILIYDPRLPPHLQGQCRDEIALVPDLAVTVLELAGIEAPECMQGDSLAPLLRGETIDWRSDFFAEQLLDFQNYPKSECVRSREWKYIRYFPRTEDPRQTGEKYRSTLDKYDEFLLASIEGRMAPVYEELYDLMNDPLEKENLAGDVKQAGTLLEARARLIELARQTR